MAKKIFSNYHLSVYETERGFVYSERRNINSTASLCFRKNNDEFEFLIRYQPIPELKNTSVTIKDWKKLYPCPVTGSMEVNETAHENACREVWEETGILVKNSIIDSKFIASTQSNEVVFCFLFDATSIKITNNKLGDGSVFEEISENRWLSEKQLHDICFNTISDKTVYLSSLLVCYMLFRQINKK